MSDFVFLEMGECRQQEVDKFNDLSFVEAPALADPARDEILQVHLRAFHDDVGEFALRILIDFLEGDKVAVIVDEVVTDFG